MNALASIPEKRIDQIIDINWFHDPMKVLFVTALVLKAVKSFKSQVTEKKSTMKEQMRLNAADLKEAENLWIRSVQASAFSKTSHFFWVKITALPRQHALHSLDCS